MSFLKAKMRGLGTAGTLLRQSVRPGAEDAEMEGVLSVSFHDFAYTHCPFP